MNRTLLPGPYYADRSQSQGISDPLRVSAVATIWDARLGTLSLSGAAAGPRCLRYPAVEDTPAVGLWADIRGHLRLAPCAAGCGNL